MSRDELKIGHVFEDLDKRMRGRMLVVYEIGEHYISLHDPLRHDIRTRISCDRLLNPRLFKLVKR